MSYLHKINRREFLNASVAAGVSLALPVLGEEKEAEKEDRKPRIFFLEGNGKDLELWAIDEEGENLERITHNEYAEISPSISPDGKFIAYTHSSAKNGYANNISILDLNTGKETATLRGEPSPILGHAPYNYDYGNLSSSGIVWSPNNNILAVNVYLSCSGEVNIFNNWIEMFRFDPSNGQINPATLPISAYHPEFLSFSPDSKKIVLGSGWGIEIGELSASKDGGLAVTLNSKPIAEKKDFEDIGRPLWSPGGNFILFDNGGIGIHKNKVYIMKTDGSQIKQIAGRIESGYTVGSPKSWSPDGAKVAYKDGRTKIVNVDTMQTTEVSGDYELFGAYNAPRWSQDGKKLAFECADGIRTADADGSNLKLLKKVDYKSYRLDNSWNAKDRAFIVGYF